jgi:hypothetical protein
MPIYPAPEGAAGVIPSTLNRHFAGEEDSELRGRPVLIVTGVALTLCVYDWLILIERGMMIISVRNFIRAEFSPFREQRVKLPGKRGGQGPKLSTSS